MTKEKPILVYLANGVQGGAVARHAIRRGFAVRAFVRDPAKSGHLRKLGIEIVSGDLQSGAGLNEAHRGIDHVVLQMPLGAPAQIESLLANAIGAIKSSGVKGVIVKTGRGKPAIQTDVPAFVLNRIIEDKMREPGVPFSILRHTMYLDNFLRPDTREGICKNGMIVYPLPAGRQIAWTSTDDAANAALNLLENRIFAGDYIVSGQDALDGEGLALAFSAALKRGIRFQSLPLKVLEPSVDSPSGAAIGRRLAIATLKFIEDHPDEASGYSARPFSPSPQLRDFRPTAIAAWIAKHRMSFA